jgi:Tfp pilus assembly protein FimV
VLLAGCVLVALASAIVAWRTAASSSTVVQTAAGPGAVVADPAAYGSGHTQPPPGSVYVVQPGDTLWSIARKLVPEGDVRAEVDRLADLNGTAALQAGERLQLAPSSGP